MSTYELALADAYDYIKTLPDESVDALITDPPYGVTALSWDKANDWLTLWPLIYQKCKPSAVQVVFGVQPFTTDLINSNRPNYRYELIWKKSQATGQLNSAWQPMREHENIIVFFRERGTYNRLLTPKKPENIRPPSKVQNGHSVYGKSKVEFQRTIPVHMRTPTSVLEYKSTQENLSPSQKPLELLCYLVKTYTNPGDTVLDLFSGSFTTGVACLLTDRHFKGCEVDPHYFDVGKKRIEAVAAQSRLEFA